MNSKTLPLFLSVATYLFLILMLATPFVQSKIFIDTTLTPKLIWFSSSTSLFVGTILIRLLIVKSTVTIAIHKIDIFILVFFLYVHLNHYFTGTSYIASKVSITTAIGISYFFLRVKLQSQSVKKWISWAIPIPYILCLITSFIALYQYAFTNSLQGLAMTVAMGNSGAVASYLAMLFPWMFLFVNSSKKSSVQYLYKITLIITLIAIFFTQARAAWLAVIISSIFLFLIKYKASIKKIIHYNTKIKYFAIIFFTTCFFFAGYALFHLKKDSANGRLFIWKRTVELIADHPITGVGFHNFGSEYPLYQASYLQNNPEDSASILANDINHPFNEYLNITAELGIVGLLLFLTILGLLFFEFKKERTSLTTLQLVCYSIILVFIVLSFFTYPFKIFSVQFLLIVTLAIIVSNTKSSPIFLLKTPIIMIVLSALCMGMFLSTASEFHRFKKASSWKEVHQLRNQLNWKTRARIFEELYPLNKDSWDFLSIYGIELTIQKEYKKAIPVLEEAIKYMKTSNLYTHLGISYEEIGNFKQSRKAYEKAIYIVPHKFFPRYRLVYLYDKMGLKKEALQLANTIVTTPAKINSKTVTGIKYEMRKYSKQNNNE